MLKMGYLSIQQGFANFLPSVESAPFGDDRLRRFNTFLLIETTLAMIVAVLVIKVFAVNSAFGATWLMTPGILIVAAFIPTAIKKRKFPKFGFNIRQMKDPLVVLCWICVAFFPLTFCGLWLLKLYGLNLHLCPLPPRNQEWISWLFYQFMYIAVAEEVFFRGYVQSNILRLTNPVMGKLPRLEQWISIVISAAVFAVAHIIIQGEIISVLTFLPGLVFGWLFIRTKSLLAPILFHGLANTCYFVMTAMLA